MKKAAAVEVRPPAGADGIEIPPGGGWLTVVCDKCRKSARFAADRRAIADLRAQAAGWKLQLGGGTVCPKCPA